MGLMNVQDMGLVEYESRNGTVWEMDSDGYEEHMA